MESSDFYSALASLPGTYNFNVDGNTITGTYTGRGSVRGAAINPVTALALRQTGGVYGSNKRETLRAGRALGLSREFTSHVYNATTSVSNRGNTQVVRGKIRSALEI